MNKFYRNFFDFLKKLMPQLANIGYESRLVNMIKTNSLN